MNRKIAILVPIIPPAVDGVGEYTFHLVETLRQKGIDTRLFTSAGQHAAHPWIHPSVRQWNADEVNRSLEGFSPDICILQYVPQLYGRYGLCWNACGIVQGVKKKYRCAFGVTVHEFASEWGVHPKKLFLAAFSRLQFIRLLSSADFAVTTCRIYESLIRAYNSKLKVKTIPVSANVEVHAADASLLREKLNPQNNVLFSFFGRLANFRNPDLAVRVLAKALEKGIPAKLVFIGCARSSQPALYDQILILANRLKVSSHLIETGDLTENEISHWLQISDVFLFPQRDGISTRNTTVMSAMAHGLPVIAFQPTPGNYDGHILPYGDFVPARDDEAFIRKAIEAAEHNKNSSMALRQKQYYADHFSWDQMASQYLEFITHAQ